MSSDNRTPRKPQARYPREEQNQMREPRSRYPRGDAQQPERQTRRTPLGDDTSRANSPYGNPTVDHSVNVSHKSDIATFFKLLTKVIIVIIALFLIANIAIRIAVPHIPYRYEKHIGAQAVDSLLMSPPASQRAAYREATAYLQNLAEMLASNMDVPQDMPIIVHITHHPMENAFATLGGNIIITQGLIEMLESENALAMVLAHEIGHVKNRDPLAGLGTGLLFSFTMAIITGNDSGTVAKLIGGVTELSFSRKQESEADKEAIQALLGYYGHTYGADEFFSKMIIQHGDDSAGLTSDFFHTHPGSTKRIEEIRATQTGDNREITPLSKELMALKNSPDKKK